MRLNNKMTPAFVIDRMRDTKSYKEWMLPLMGSGLDHQPSKLLTSLNYNSDLIELRVETMCLYFFNKINTLQFIRSTFKEPKSGQWVIGFKLTDKIQEIHEMSIYLTFGEAKQVKKPIPN